MCFAKIFILSVLKKLLNNKIKIRNSENHAFWL